MIIRTKYFRYGAPGDRTEVSLKDAIIEAIRDREFNQAYMTEITINGEVVLTRDELEEIAKYFLHLYC